MALLEVVCAYSQKLISPLSIPVSSKHTLVPTLTRCRTGRAQNTHHFPFLKVLTRIYGAEVVGAHNYSRIVSSLLFAGTVLGMLSFG